MQSSLWVNPRIRQIRIRVWPLISVRWFGLKQWGIVLAHNETTQEPAAPTQESIDA